MEKKLMGQDKGSLIKQKQRLSAEAKENKKFVLYFPSAGTVQPWEVGLQYAYRLLWKTNTEIINAPPLLSLNFTAEQTSYSTEYSSG